MRSDAFLLGLNAYSDEYRLPADAFSRHIAIVGGPSEGKTSILVEAARYLSGMPNAMVVLDLVGAAFRGIASSVASEAAQLRLSTINPSAGEAAAKQHLSRYAFSQPDDQGAIVGFDLLRPVPLPSGRVESFGMVASRVIEGFRFEKPELRVRFAKYATSVIVLLSAGCRPVTEWQPLLEGETSYCRRLRKLHELRGIDKNQEVQHAWHRIGLLHDMSGHQKREHMDSTESGFEPFTDPAVGGFFTVGNVRLEDILFGNSRLIVSVDQIPGFNKAFLVFSMTLKSILHLGRKRNTAQFPYPLVVLCDEVAWIDMEELKSGMELARNFGVSLVISRQHWDAHFDGDGTAKMIETCSGTLINFPQQEPGVMERLVPTYKRVSPDGLWIMRDVLSESDNIGGSETDTESANWGAQFSTARSRNTRAFMTPDVSERKTASFNADGKLVGTTVTPAQTGQPMRQDTEGETQTGGGSTGGGTSRSIGTTWMKGSGVTHQPHRIPVSEQKDLIADEMRNAPPFSFFVTRNRVTHLVHGIKERTFPRFVRLSTGVHDLLTDAMDTMLELLVPPVRPDLPELDPPTPPPTSEPPDPRDAMGPNLKPNGKQKGRHDRGGKGKAT